MNDKNATEVIFQKIVNGDNNLDNNLIKDTTPEVKPSKKQQSVYDNIIDTLEMEIKGANDNGNNQ